MINKMKYPLRINYTEKKIVMDKEFSIKAARFGSTEYKKLQDALQQLSGFEIQVKEIKTNDDRTVKIIPNVETNLVELLYACSLNTKNV